MITGRSGCCCVISGRRSVPSSVGIRRSSTTTSIARARRRVSTLTLSAQVVTAQPRAVRPAAQTVRASASSSTSRTRGAAPKVRWPFPLMSLILQGSIPDTIAGMQDRIIAAYRLGLGPRDALEQKADQIALGQTVGARAPGRPGAPAGRARPPGGGGRGGAGRLGTAPRRGGRGRALG